MAVPNYESILPICLLQPCVNITKTISKSVKFLLEPTAKVIPLTVFGTPPISFFLSFFVFLLVNLTYLQFDVRMCSWLKQNAGIIGCAESTLIGGSIYCR